MSASDTSSYAHPLDLYDEDFEGQYAKYKPKPAKGNTFFWPLAFIFTVFLLQISNLLSLYLGATYAGSFSFLPPRTACRSAIKTLDTAANTAETATVTATATITVTVTIILTTTATPEPTPKSTAPWHIVDRSCLPAGFPVSFGLWKQLARKQFYYDCFQGCRAEGAGCDAWTAGKWEMACRQTDRSYYGDVDCSGANLLEAAGGRLGDEVPIPEVCLEKLARLLQKMRADKMEAEEKGGK